jgi:membrane protease YdiL (CAAX protease family)
MNFLLLGVTFIMFGIAGESLSNEVFKSKPYSSFLYYLRTSFYNRAVSRAVFFGYCLFFIMIGVQAAIFYLGQKYLGVWKEWFRLTQFSSAYLPFLSALAIGINASFNEEVLFRLFGITWGKKYLKNTVLAIVFTSLIWGFGHSQYAIFPVWFRGIEVSILGLIYGFIFVRYGLIPLITAHYLFDVFWGVAAYILGHTTKYLFASSVFILAIPLIFACAAYFANKEEKEKEIGAMLDGTQEYNLGILRAFVSLKKSQGFDAVAISKELIGHNWDIELVDLAIKKVFKG